VGRESLQNRFQCRSQGRHCIISGRGTTTHPADDLSVGGHDRGERGLQWHAEWAIAEYRRQVKHTRYHWLMLAQSHVTRRLFGSTVRLIGALAVGTG